MAFENKHHCKKCGKLLFKSAKEAIGSVEIMCSRRECKEVQEVCFAPIPIEEQMKNRNRVYSSEQAEIKDKFRQGTKQV